MDKKDIIKRHILRGMEDIKVSMEELQDAQATGGFDYIIDGLVNHVMDTVPDNAVELISKIEITRHVDEDTFAPVFSANVYVDSTPAKKFEEEE